MSFIGDIKHLILQPSKAIPSYCGKNDPQKAAFSVVYISLITSIVFVFSQLYPMINLFWKIGRAELLLVNMAISIAQFTLVYYLMHKIAQWLGGKGKFLDLLSLALRFAVPFVTLSLVVFIPAIGETLSVFIGLFGLYLFYILYRHMRLVYKLSLARSIVSIIIPYIIVIVIITALVGLAIYLIFTSFLDSGGVKPTVTETQFGNHFYSPLHGGYSFDYPISWALDYDSSGNEPASLALTHNEFISLDILQEKKTNRTIMVSFIFQNKETNIGEACDRDLFRLYATDPNQGNDMDYSNADAKVVSFGETEGCLVSNAYNKKSSKYQSFYISTSCFVYSPVWLMLSVDGKDNAPLQALAESLKCGPTAS